MSQKHRLKAEHLLMIAQDKGLDYVAIESDCLARIISEFYRLRDRMVKAEMENIKLKRNKPAKPDEGRAARTEDLDGMLLPCSR